MADMLNSSRDTCTLLKLEPTFALVLKLTVATVLTVAEGSDTAEIARLEISYTVQCILKKYFHQWQLKFFVQLYSIFIIPHGQLCIITLPILLRFYFVHYSRIILDSLAHLLFSKLFPNN